MSKSTKESSTTTITTTITGKVLALLTQSKNTKEKAARIAKAIKPSLFMAQIAPLKAAIHEYEGEMAELEEMSLEADINRGIKALSQSDVEQRVNRLIQLSFCLADAQRELDIKSKAFGEYLGTIPTLE